MPVLDPKKAQLLRSIFILVREEERLDEEEIGILKHMRFKEFYYLQNIIHLLRGVVYKPGILREKPGISKAYSKAVTLYSKALTELAILGKEAVGALRVEEDIISFVRSGKFKTGIKFIERETKFTLAEKKALGEFETILEDLEKEFTTIRNLAGFLMKSARSLYNLAENIYELAGSAIEWSVAIRKEGIAVLEIDKKIYGENQASLAELRKALYK